MVHGHGVRGGRGRCYPFFEDFVDCVNAAGAGRAFKCLKQAEDYKECLHLEKTADRITKIETHKAELAAAGKLHPDVERLLTTDFKQGFKPSSA
eukprot:m.23151 g.23151  ORF g.23151 m.23151 type:complete len:94 (+) comp34742_c0_seq2:84-365(+)